MEELNSEKYILYIQWQEKLDSAFIRFAAEFKRYNINLIPVKPQELDYFLDRRQIPVIMMTSTLAEYQKFRSLRKKYFDYYVNHKKIKLFHLNSFSLVTDFISTSRQRSYIHVPLPIPFNRATLLVLSHYVEELEGDNRWPGGKRSKLPSIGETDA